MEEVLHWLSINRDSIIIGIIFLILSAPTVFISKVFWKGFKRGLYNYRKTFQLFIDDAAENDDNMGLAQMTFFYCCFTTIILLIVASGFIPPEAKNTILVMMIVASLNMILISALINIITGAYLKRKRERDKKDQK